MSARVRYYFNICGYANKKCLPNYMQRYVYGTAVQSYGSPPPCNTSDNSTMCLNYLNGNYECCTEPCEVLGTGIPIYSVMNPNNPMAGERGTVAAATAAAGVANIV